MLSSTLSRKGALMFFAAASLFGSVAIASALTVSPARIELSGDPGSPVTGKMLVTNEQDRDQTFYTSVENFEAQGETGTPNFTPSKEGLASWVSVESQITIKKGERVEIPFTINVPKDADAGGHFAAIFLSTSPTTAKAGEVAVGAKVGSLILLRVSGDIKEGAQVLSFGLKDGGSFVSSLPVDFTYRFSNSGNDRANPKGNIVIRNTIGMESASIDANPTTGNVLPNSVRRFDTKWGEEVLPADASFLDKVSYEARNFAFGIYFANLDLSFGSTGKVESSTTFFVLPWHLLIVVILVLVGLYYAFGAYKKSIIAKSHK